MTLSRSRRQALRIASFALMGIAAAAAGPAQSQSAFPTKPLTLIVPYPPGGGTDALARVIGPRLSEVLGQSVVIDNRPGAGGSLGTALAARAPADGHHLLILNTLPHTSAAGLYDKLSYDPVKDFAGVGSIATTPYVFVANPGVPAQTIGEFIALAKASPGKYRYGSAGTGSATHLVPELFKLVTRTQITHVPYRGGGPAIVDLIGGHIDLVSDNLFSSIPNIKAGKIRALAVTSRKRSVIFPEIPSVAEAGYGDFEVVGQFGLVVPAATPRPAVERLSAALAKVVRSPDVSQQILAQGGEPAISTPEEFDALMRSESAKWLRVIREARIKPE
jgi:tripartite-type tricarboxylate transporter receptor subunit TctC